MATNLSLNFGVPSIISSAKQQHSKLVKLLKNNEVFCFKFQNRGYLALEKATGSLKGAFVNILYKTKPSRRKKIKITKV